jgi:hypothetical protein
VMRKPTDAGNAVPETISKWSSTVGPLALLLSQELS